MEKVLKEYINATNEPYKNHPIANLIRKEIPESFKNEIGNDYQIKGSSGIGRWAAIPWISFINEKITTTPQDGYYVVYLFKEDMTGFYLSLNFGAREFNRNYGRKNLPIAAKIFREILQNKFSEIKNYIPMDLGSLEGNSKRPNSKDYENGNIFSIEYTIDNIPTDDYLIDDLFFILTLYDYLYEIRGNTIFSDDELKFFNINADFHNGNVKRLEDSMCLSIRNFGAISKADLEINKINIIAGKNATGKSTASKLLYCFLKYNSHNRQNFAYKSVSEQFERLFSRIVRVSRDFPEKFHSPIKNLWIDFLNCKDIYKEFEIYDKIKEIFYNNAFNSISSKSTDELFDSFDEIDELINIIEEDGSGLYKSIIKSLFESEFSNEITGFAEFKGNYNNHKFNFSANYTNSYQFESQGEFFINDVFYIDSFSWLDIRSQSRHSVHINSLFKSIEKDSDESYDIFDDLKNKNIIKLENNLYNLLNGKFIFEEGQFKYSDEEGVSYSLSNASSGMKQLGVIQLLLKNRQLKPNSVLIIDEPEVNLHPGWQFKYAELLVILARDLDIKLYINTHSPIFIEAIEVFTKYYDLEDETNFYLTQKSDNNKYDFVKCNYSNLYDIYENLAEPFDIIEVYRLKAEYKKNNR